MRWLHVSPLGELWSKYSLSPMSAECERAESTSLALTRSLARWRRRAKVRRRDQIRRRRAVTLAVLVTLIVLAVWAAYAIPGQTPARVPQSAAMPTVDGSPAVVTSRATGRT